MYYKYPRTYHFPFSPGVGSDDKIFDDFEKYFDGRKVVISEKMDGENSTIYRGYYHARSIDSKHKAYHSWLMNYIRSFNYLLDNNERVCGEYLYAKHSIEYKDLVSYFMAFSVWRDNKCLSWSDTINRCNSLGISTVPVLYVGKYDMEQIKKCIGQVSNRNGEGIVMRLADSFDYNDFTKSVIKYVRANHVQTDKHWSEGIITKNKLITV